MEVWYEQVHVALGVSEILRPVSTLGATASPDGELPLQGQVRRVLSDSAGLRVDEVSVLGQSESGGRVARGDVVSWREMRRTVQIHAPPPASQRVSLARASHPVNTHPSPRRVAGIVDQAVPSPQRSGLEQYESGR